MRKVTKGNVTIKIWDIGGQPRFRSMWERYCRGVNAIVYMIDAADREKIEASRNELHNLLDKPQLQGIPVLVLGNKRDLPNALDEKQLIEKMNLSAIQDREICCYSISCKEKDNIDITLQWLIQHSKSRRSWDIFWVFQSFLAIILELLSFLWSTSQNMVLPKPKKLPFSEFISHVHCWRCVFLSFITNQLELSW